MIFLSEIFSWLYLPFVVKNTQPEVLNYLNSFDSFIRETCQMLGNMTCIEPTNSLTIYFICFFVSFNNKRYISYSLVSSIYVDFFCQMG